MRGRGHFEGDAQVYRPEEDASWTDRDPLVRTVRELGVDPDTAAQLDADAELEMAGAVEQALAAPYPDETAVLEDVYA